MHNYYYIIGEFGLVYKGKLKYGQAMTEFVAVKTLKGLSVCQMWNTMSTSSIIIVHPGLYDQTSVDKLLQECVKMHGLDHPNVLTLKGVCLDGGTVPFIILPFMKNGSLLSFLQREKNKLLLTSSEKCEDEVNYCHMHSLYMPNIFCSEPEKGQTEIVLLIPHHPGPNL